MKTALILLTYNAAQDIPHLMPAILKQTLKPDVILAIDSSSPDNTADILSQYPVQIHQIPQAEFDHGGTRQLATMLVDADIYIYLTQDAYPADADAFQALINKLTSHEKIGCTYGRQLPKPEATPVSAHLRYFNYPEDSYIRSLHDRTTYGIKTCFNSDSFAAYKKTALNYIGNFPRSLMTAEDAYVAARMLIAGYKIAYAAEARVFHSHNLSLSQEFHRYFSIGVFHQSEKWILKNFGRANNEGFRFVKSEIAYLCHHKQYKWLPRAIASTAVKLIGYHLGRRERFIPHSIKSKLGINKAYWKNINDKIAVN